MVQTKNELPCLHYDYMSFTECNSYSTTFLNLAQCAVHMMYTRAQSDNLLGFYTQISITI